MNILFKLLIITCIAIVAIWLVRQVEMPTGLEIIKTISLVIIILIILMKVLELL